MPWTNFPNGISTTTATGTVAGQINATSIAAVSGSYSGTVSVPSGGYNGETAVLTFSCGSVSTASAVYAAVPFDGDVIAASVVVGATVAVTTLHTLLINSATATGITVTNASGTIGKVTSATVAAVVAVTTANSLRVTRAVSGTAGDTWFSATIART